MIMFPAFGFLDAAADYPADSVVVMVGILLVFLILLLLTFIIKLQGKIFDHFEAKRKAKQQDTPPSAPAAAAAPAPVVEAGISPEVVAAISAAIAAMGDGKYQLRALSRARDCRGAWGKAGVVNDTEPF